MHSRTYWLRAAAIPLFLLVALVLVFYRPASPPPEKPPGAVTLRPVSIDQSSELIAHFDGLDYSWPPQEPVPRVGVQALPPDINELDTQSRREVFLQSLLPLILAENRRLVELHHFVAGLNNDELTESDREKLENLFERYRITGDVEDPEARNQLMRRLDAIPADLALAQAANESGWGTSRFTREANNLFGEWTWDPEAGLKPQQRREGATHFVRVFPNLESSVRTYMFNLNVGHAYQEFRRKREAMRNRDESLDGLVLAGGLERYSERGTDYIDEIRSMIRFNNLQQINDIELAAVNGDP